MADGRGARIALEAGFLVVVAAVLGVAHVRPLWIVLVMLLAWVIVALLEWAAWRDEPHWGSGMPPRYYVPPQALPPRPPSQELPAFDAYPRAPVEVRAAEAPTWIATPEMREELLGWPTAAAPADDAGGEERPAAEAVEAPAPQPPPALARPEPVVEAQPEPVVEVEPQPEPVAEAEPEAAPALEAEPVALEAPEEHVLEAELAAEPDEQPQPPPPPEEHAAPDELPDELLSVAGAAADDSRADPFDEPPGWPVEDGDTAHDPWVAADLDEEPDVVAERGELADEPAPAPTPAEPVAAAPTRLSRHRLDPFEPAAGGRWPWRRGREQPAAVAELPALPRHLRVDGGRSDG